MTHDNRHHVVYDCDGEQHTKVRKMLREAGVVLVEAGPESFYARDIKNKQRAADATQFAQAKTEISRLRAAIVDTLNSGDLTHIREALQSAARLEWSWRAAEERGEETSA